MPEFLHFFFRVLKMLEPLRLNYLTNYNVNPGTSAESTYERTSDDATMIRKKQRLTGDTFSNGDDDDDYKSEEKNL